VINNFSCSKKKVEDFVIKANIGDKINVIEALDGQLITNNILNDPKIINGKLESDIEDDILKIVVVNRYKDAPIAKAFIKNFGLKKGAIASSVAHDSHNIVAVGVDDESICDAVNKVIDGKGGVSVSFHVGEGWDGALLALPIAGLMSNEDGYKVAASYTSIDKIVKDKLGSTLSSPYMTLSFMALLVIPHLKLSDKGLFDGDAFKLIG
jgi:adenine deaminase